MLQHQSFAPILRLFVPTIRPHPMPLCPHSLLRFAHDDGTCTSHLSAYTPALTSTAPYGSSTYRLPKSYLSVASESGVVSIYGADRDAFSGSYDFAGSLGGVPKQLKSVMNLTTQITSTCFHPSGQILAIASNQVSVRVDSSSTYAHRVCMHMHVSAMSLIKHSC
jgi:hypothetical protein